MSTKVYFISEELAEYNFFDAPGDEMETLINRSFGLEEKKAKGEYQVSMRALIGYLNGPVTNVFVRAQAEKRVRGGFELNLLGVNKEKVYNPETLTADDLIYYKLTSNDLSFVTIYNTKQYAMMFFDYLTPSRLFQPLVIAPVNMDARPTKYYVKARRSIPEIRQFDDRHHGSAMNFLGTLLS